MEEFKVKDLQHFLSLWQNIYTDEGKVCWDNMLPYYDENIFFKDSVQEIRGKKNYAKMTRRLAKRAKNLKFLIHNSAKKGEIIFVEWEMVISYKKYPKSSVYGASKILLKDGKVLEQRDYYDLWGDIFDNIKFIAKGYRRFMRKRFG
jgi:limonene-1,2-epoxide hydrolase